MEITLMCFIVSAAPIAGLGLLVLATHLGRLADLKQEELNVRRLEAQVRLEETKQRRADLPDWVDPDDPAEVSEWENAKREVSQKVVQNKNL